jgi:hypothetical protein
MRKDGGAKTVMTIEERDPRAVLRWIAALVAIPRGIGNTKAVIDFCVRFAEDRWMACVRTRTITLYHQARGSVL